MLISVRKLDVATRPDREFESGKKLVKQKTSIHNKINNL